MKPIHTVTIGVKISQKHLRFAYIIYRQAIEVLKKQNLKSSSGHSSKNVIFL